MNDQTTIPESPEPKNFQGEMPDAPMPLAQDEPDESATSALAAPIPPEDDPFPTLSSMGYSSLRDAPPGMKRMFYEGSKAIYAALSLEAGDYSGILHNDRWRYSIMLALGSKRRPEELGIDLYGRPKTPPATTESVAVAPAQTSPQQIPVADATDSGIPGSTELGGLSGSVATPYDWSLPQPTGSSDAGATVSAIPPTNMPPGLEPATSPGRKARTRRIPPPYLTRAQIGDLDRALSEAQARGATPEEQQEVVSVFKDLAALQGQMHPVRLDSGAQAQDFMGLIKPDVRLTAGGDIARDAEKHFSALNEHARPGGLSTYMALVGDSQMAGGRATAASLSMSAISPILAAIVTGMSGAKEPHAAGTSNLAVHTDPKPLSHIDIDGKLYPLYSHGDASKLSPGTGLIFVLEGPDQRTRSGNMSTAAQFEAATPGAMSDPVTGRRIVPALRYTNDVTFGQSVKRLDGFETSHVIPLALLEAKYNFDSMNSGRKSNTDVRRAEKAFKDNPTIPGVFELPSDVRAKQYERRIGKAVDTELPPNMTIRGRRK